MEKNQKKLVNKTDICFDIYNNSILYKYEYQGLYYEYCINENAKKNKTISYCKYDDENCISCPNDWSECNQDYHEIENDNDTYGYKKCYKDPIGYYLDINESKYKNVIIHVKNVKLKEIIQHIIV